MMAVACIFGSVAFFIIIYCIWEAIDDNRTAISVLRGSVNRLSDENDSLRARVARLERVGERHD